MKKHLFSIFFLIFLTGCVKNDSISEKQKAIIKKTGDKYVLFGTGWSTDTGRKGSYNLYYATADKVTGPYSERRFAGCFLGHGTPFQDKRYAFSGSRRSTNN